MIVLVVAALWAFAWLALGLGKAVLVVAAEGELCAEDVGSTGGCALEEATGVALFCVDAGAEGWLEVASEDGAALADGMGELEGFTSSEEDGAGAGAATDDLTSDTEEECAG